MGDFFLSDAAIIFFTAWCAMVATVVIVAFGRDLLPARFWANGPEHLNSHAAPTSRPV
jgi:hypothetical protein